MGTEAFLEPDYSFSDDLVEQEALISIVWQGKVVRVQREEFEIYDIKTSREIVAHPGAVGVIAVNAVGEFAYVKQFRRAIRGFLVEPVAGLLDKPNETPLQAAQREMLEETGLESSKWSFLIDLVVSPGGTTEIIRYFLAEEVRPSREARIWTNEAEEKKMPLIWVKNDQVINAILEGKIHNSVGIAASLIAIERLKGSERISPNKSWQLFQHLSQSGGINPLP